MQIPPFYVHAGVGEKSCSDNSVDENKQLLYTDQKSCVNAGGTWDFLPPYGWEVYVKGNYHADEHGQDFYWTGVHRMSFNTGPNPDYTYKGAHGTWADPSYCSDSQYTTQETCEANGESWEAGYENANSYKAGDMVSIRAEYADLTNEKVFYYALQDNDSFPSNDSANWEQVHLKSYIYGGKDGTLDPGAYHAYDTCESKISNRYNEGCNAAAREAVMGPSYEGHGNDWTTTRNEESDPKQFYIADHSHFNIYETCHGHRPVHMQGTSGNFNFYNAAYPGGYYLPPHGERPTLTVLGSNPTDVTINLTSDGDFAMEDYMAGGCCAAMGGLDDLGHDQDLAMWGMRTVFPKKGAMVTWDETRGDEHGIHAPHEECPPAKPPAVYFDRELFGFHPGSIMAPAAGTFYNDNPFPNGLDIDGWYHNHVYETQRCSNSGGIYAGYKLSASFPKLMYPIHGSTEKKLDAGICKARECETSQLLGYNFEGVQGGFGSGPGSKVNDDASFATYDPFIYWHFVFRYNHDSLWNYTHNTLTNKVVQYGDSSVADGENSPISNHLWEYRQCPNTPDFLPWSADIPIHACPSHYFDIPYYAAIGKFGFYGARFFNSCSIPVAIAEGETQEPGLEWNYYEGQRASSDGRSFDGPMVTMKCRADRCGTGGGIFRINDGCYKVRFARTSEDDLPVDLVFSSLSDSQFEDKQESIPLYYYIYEASEFLGTFALGNWKKVGEVVWDTLVIDITACENCVNGGAAAVADATIELEKKLEAKFGMSIEGIKTQMGQWERGGVSSQEGQGLCTTEACAQWFKHGTTAFNFEITLQKPFDDLEAILRTHAIMFGVNNSHATEGSYSTFESQVDLVRDWSAGVQDCDVYEEPQVAGGTCDTKHYDTLLQIADNEQRINEFFVGNKGFFLWANYEHIVNSYEYTNLLTGEKTASASETHFKRSLYRLWQDFDQLLLSLPNFFGGNNDPVIYYEKAINGLFGNEALDYSQQGLFNDMLFSNNRYRQFISEIEWNDVKNIFSWSVERPNHVTQIEAWDKILTTYGHYIANNGGGPDSDWYYEAMEAKEARIRTRFTENKLRGKAIDLYPTNQISFSWDSASPYITGKHWGNSQWGHSTVGHFGGSNDAEAARYDPLPGDPDFKPQFVGDLNPGVMRQYFHGVYARKSSATGFQKEIVDQGQAYGGTHYYAGLYQDFSCGGDMPRANYSAGGIAVDVSNKGIPSHPWISKGYNEVGNVNQGFSCFSPIFTQQPLNVACKVGQRPIFRAQAVDYHTIPEDKVGKGYPEIDYWTNSLKLTNSKGELKYPVEYQWYRILKKHDPFGRQVKHGQLNATRLEDNFDAWFYADDPICQKASITGEWACLEGVSGKGGEECTMFHPQVSYTHGMIDGTNKEADGHTPIAAYTNTARRYGAEHWTQLVDYQGLTHHLGSSNAQGDHRLWKTWRYIQGCHNEAGRYSTDPNQYGKEADDNPISAIPCFGATVKDGGMAYFNMLKDEYSLINTAGDDDYMYFCVASGRFGFRRSEAANLDIEDWLKIDFSIRNGAPCTVPFNSIQYEYTRVDGEGPIMEASAEIGGAAGAFKSTWTTDDEGNTVAVPATPEGCSDTQYTTESTCESNGGTWTEMMGQCESCVGDINHPQSDENTVKRHGAVTLIMGFGAPKDKEYSWMAAAKIPPYAGIMRDVNACWENRVMEQMNMSNNCRSFAFVGLEGYRGATRSFMPPVQANQVGTQAHRAGWFEYGLLYPFGTQLNQAWGNALYSQPQMPVCRDYMMPHGNSAQGFKAAVILDPHQASESIDDVRQGVDDCGRSKGMMTVSQNLHDLVFKGRGNATGGTFTEAAAAQIYHNTTVDRAIFVTELRAGVPPSKGNHQGEFYPWNGDSAHNVYDTEFSIASHGKGATWQFDNNLGTIKRFGHFVALPKQMVQATDNGYRGRAANSSAGQLAEGGILTQTQQGSVKLKVPDDPTARAFLEDTRDVYFWAWGSTTSMAREFRFAKAKIHPWTLAGINCGWRKDSCGRFMLYFVEAMFRYYNNCHDDPKKGKERNLSFHSPGLRQGAAACQYFIGGFPRSTYVKRSPLMGPYAYDWKVQPHNRDRNGNGMAESFYSTKHDRPMYQYDPPAIYGLWAKQGQGADGKGEIEPKTIRLRHLRIRAQGGGYMGQYTSKEEYEAAIEGGQGSGAGTCSGGPGGYCNVSEHETKETCEEEGGTWFLADTERHCNASGGVWTAAVRGRGSPTDLASPALRDPANGMAFIPVHLVGSRFGPYGMSKHGGCGSFRLGCVDTPHLSRPQHFLPGDPRCDWYKYAISFGMDHGSKYGCNEKQLMAGVCFDPCLSMKYNYGFFPGGKLLTVNNFVKYSDSRHNPDADGSEAEPIKGGPMNSVSFTAPRPSSSTLNSSQTVADIQVVASIAAGETVLDEIPEVDLEDVPGGDFPLPDPKTGKIEPEEKSQGTHAGAGAAVKKSEGARFITQLTNDVADEEFAISKNKASKFCRILRGPWATPYRRIKTQIARDVRGNPSDSKVLNNQETILDGMGTEVIQEPQKFFRQQNLQPSSKRAMSLYTNTTVSPCNHSGADHCNYITPTIHIGMDTLAAGTGDAFTAMGRALGGGYTISKEITLVGEMSSLGLEVAEWLITDAVIIIAQLGFAVLTGGGSLYAQLIGAVLSGGVAAVQTAWDYYNKAKCGNAPGVFATLEQFSTALLSGLGLTDQSGAFSPTGTEQLIGERALNGAGFQTQESVLQDLDRLHQQGQLVII